MSDQRKRSRIEIAIPHFVWDTHHSGVTWLFGPWYVSEGEQVRPKKLLRRAVAEDPNHTSHIDIIAPVGGAITSLKPNFVKWGIGDTPLLGTMEEYTLPTKSNAACVQYGHNPNPGLINGAVGELSETQSLTYFGSKVREHYKKLSALSSKTLLLTNDYLALPRVDDVNASTFILVSRSTSARSTRTDIQFDTPHQLEKLGEPTEPKRKNVALNSSLMLGSPFVNADIAAKNPRRLLGVKKLSLVLDLDHTIIHSTSDRLAARVFKFDTALTESEFFHFTTPKDTFYIKARPGLAKFLLLASEVFELHIYTMGDRPYARSVAKALDPTGALFGSRIVSRDEFPEGQMSMKNLNRVFPCDISKVLILDDREDNWTKNGTSEYQSSVVMDNILRVRPYKFWSGLKEEITTSAESSMDTSKTTEQGVYDRVSADDSNDKGNDIVYTPVNQKLTYNSSPALPSLEFSTPILDTAVDKEHVDRTIDCGNAHTHDRVVPTRHSNSWRGMTCVYEENDICRERNPKMHRLPIEELDAKMNGECTGYFYETKKICKTHQNTTGEDKSVDSCTQYTSTSVDNTERLHFLQRACLGYDGADSDDYLLRMFNVLRQVHSRVSRIPDPVTADTAKILQNMRREILFGLHICFTGVFMANETPQDSIQWRELERFGAICHSSYSPAITHLIAHPVRGLQTRKLNQARGSKSVFIVQPSWVNASIRYFRRASELKHALYPITKEKERGKR
eukprot:CFRG3015T1